MKIILIGAPGVGKGTQADLLCQHFAIPKISTGDILRQAVKDSTKLGQKAKKLMDEGQLVSDDIIIEIVENRLQASDCEKGYLLDGFPRTLSQAEKILELGISVDACLSIEVPDEEIIKRLTGRFVHMPSGRVYHLEYNPPKVTGLDDETQEPLTQRDDDKAETVLKRLSVFREQTKPVVEFYKQLFVKNKILFESFSGEGEIKDISFQITQYLKTHFTQ